MNPGSGGTVSPVPGPRDAEAIHSPGLLASHGSRFGDGSPVRHPIIEVSLPLRSTRRTPVLYLLLLLAGAFPGRELAWAVDAPSSPCPTQPAAGTSVTLAQAIDLALCNNPRTRQTWIAARIGATQVDLARVPYRPEVSARAELSRNETRNVARPGGETVAAASLAIDYLLFDFGGRDATLEQARAALEAARWNHDATLQAVMLDAISAHIQVAAALEAQQSARTAEQSSARSLEAAQARARAGTATRADVLQAQTAHSQDRLTRTQAEGDVAAARGVFASTLGLPVDLSLEVVTFREAGPDALVERSVPALLELARRKRPELAAAQAQVRAARQNLRIQESADRPTVSLSGSLGATQRVPGADPRTAAVGIALNVPLYTGGRTAYQKLLAEQQVEAQLATQQRLEQDVALEVWRAFQDLGTQRQAVASAEDLVASAQESYNVTLGRYRAGVGAVTDLLNAQAALAKADLQRVQARYRWNLAKATLARALGILDRSLPSP